MNTIFIKELTEKFKGIDQEIIKEIFIAGCTEGHAEGHIEGYLEGYDKGFNNGHKEGHEDGYEEGYWLVKNQLIQHVKMSQKGK